MTLANGLRRIVETDKSTPTVSIIGEVRQQPDLEVPSGKEGLDSVTGGLFVYGTTSLDRLAFQKALDVLPPRNPLGRNFRYGY